MNSQSTTTIKVLSKGTPEVSEKLWNRQLPRDLVDKTGVRFVFDPNCQNYDWLVVYDDLPMPSGAKHSLYAEDLRCDPRNTVLITAEPSSIKLYSSDFCQQFGWVLSSQESWAIRHPNHVLTQPGLRWFYGHGKSHTLSYEAIADGWSESKSDRVSVVCSSKAHRHTLHYHRVQFVKYLKQRMPELEVYGHGVRPLDDKAQALDSFRYHIAIENHVAPHHWTEKLSDTFLGAALPFYYGAPNAAAYFPADSFIPIDLARPQQAATTICDAIVNDEYSRRLPAILEARRLVLEQHQLLAYLRRMVNNGASGQGHLPIPGDRIVSRRLARQGMRSALRYLGEQTITRARGTAVARRSITTRNIAA